MRTDKAILCSLCITILILYLLLRLRFYSGIISPQQRVQIVPHERYTTRPGKLPNTDALFRQTRLILTEVWRLNNAQLRTVYNQTSPLVGQLHSLLSQATLQLTARLTILEKLSGHRERRRQAVDALSAEFFSRLSRLQNPPDCNRSRFALGNSKYEPICGYGCTAHTVAWKLSYTFATNRTLLVAPNDWKAFFLPVSNCSQSHVPAGQPEFGFEDYPIRGINESYRPPAMPREWSARLAGLLADPFPWYRGQFMGYILRPADPSWQQAIETELKNMRSGLDEGEAYDGPIASMHIRRTDKLVFEAKFHALEEYMSYVEHFFDLKEAEYILETGNTSPPAWSRRRRVFLASDDATVFHEAKLQYSRYNFVGKLRSGSNLKHRGSSEGVFAITLDMNLLTAADFIVCTSSSNVCRLAYELLLTKSTTNGDAAFQLQSVDEMYEVQFTQKRRWTAIADFKHEGVKLGDQVFIWSTQWDGFLQTKWTSNGTRNVTLPAYLFKEVVYTT